MEGDPKKGSEGVQGEGPGLPPGSVPEGSGLSDKKSRFRRWYRRFILFREKCPVCGEYSVKWVKDWIVDPEEPTMFGHWLCEDCGAFTLTQPTKLTIDAAKQQLGNCSEGTREVLKQMIEDAEKTGFL
jgi:rRNA maturation protein Nop10